MRRVLLVVVIGVMVGFAGCADVSVDDGSGDDLTDGTTDGGDINDADGQDAVDTDETDGEDEPDRDTDDDPPPSDDTNPDTLDGEVEIHHIDVGQADSTLIRTPDGEIILIDTGDWRQGGEGVIAYLEAEGIDRIDHLVSTHGHADHIGGHDAVIEWAETEGNGIGIAYDNGVPHTSATYDRYLDAVEEYEVDLRFVEGGDELPIADDAVDALVVNPPEGDSGSDLHYNSVAIVFEFGDVTYLTTGDAERAAEERMVDQWAAELNADVYQAGHHGSSTSSTQPFLDIVDPAVGIISSNYDSQYGHPHDEVLERFGAMDVETYWTGVHGNIVVTTDGDEITVEATDEFSTNPADLLEEKPDDD